jgi:flagellar protein FliO/FliZ
LDDGLNPRKQLQMGFWLTMIVVASLVMVAAAFIARGYMTGKPITGSLFAPKPEKRLAVVEHASVDGRRRLILVRRDNVEHLIMTGGPVDVVVETGIGAGKARANGHDVTESVAAQPVFSRPPRALGQAVNE